MKIVLTGATGLVGSRFFDVFKDKYEIVPVSSAFGVDITNRKQTHKFLSGKNPALIIHLAAKTNVDACEEDKDYDIKKLKAIKAYKDGEVDFEKLDSLEWKNSNSAFGVNALGTKNLADYARKKNIKLVYISTDFVFDGERDEPYSEKDTPRPIDWYGQTKYYGEKTVPADSLTVRISYPFGYKSNIKSDLIWVLVNLLQKNTAMKLVFDQIITPTFIEDIVLGLDFLIEKKETGVVHLVGNNHLSPSEIGVAVAREFNLNESMVELTTRAEFYRNRAPRPFKLILKNDKLKNLGFEMTDFFEALKLIRQANA